MINKNYLNFKKTQNSISIYSNHIQHVYYTLNLLNFKFYSDFNLIATNISYLSFSEQNLKFNSNNLLLSNFLFFKKSTMTSFFILNMIDVPIKLKQTKSIYFKSFELPILRFLNYLMRGGLRNPVLKGLNNAIFRLSHKWIN